MTVRQPAAAIAASIAAALLVAGSAAAQTPETPGAEGAIAAVDAFVAAQRRQDWAAALRLLAPEAVAALRADVPQMLADARTVLADSGRAAVPDDDDVMPGYDRFETARRTLATVRDARSPDEALVGLTALDASLEPTFLLGPDRAVRPVGVQLEGDLAHVVVRTDEDVWRTWSPVGVATLRWADGHWGFLSTDESFWFMGRPDVSGLANSLHRSARRGWLDKVPAPPAAAQSGPTPAATPATPGPAGAEAAAYALVAAQAAQDWTAIFVLLNPDALAEAAAAVRTVARQLHATLADSATVVTSEDFQDAAGDPAGGVPVVFRGARRLDAVVPPGTNLSDVDVMARVLQAAGARNPSRLRRFREPPALVVLGVVTEGESLAHVVGRAAGEPASDTRLVAMRWTGSRWAAAYRHLEGPALEPLDTLLGSDWTEPVFDVLRDKGDLEAADE